MKAAALKPNVVILDMGLPKMDGWEVDNKWRIEETERGLRFPRM